MAYRTQNFVELTILWTKKFDFGTIRVIKQLHLLNDTQLTLGMKRSQLVPHIVYWFIIPLRLCNDFYSAFDRTSIAR